MKTRNQKTPDINDLMDAVKFENKAKSLCARIWAIIAGICTIIAAVFSVLSFFKD